jgi:hypothetical protein
METERDNENEEMENDVGSYEISETTEETGENYEKTDSAGEETGEEGIEEESGEISSEYEALETQVLVEVDSNHELSSEINTFSYETVVLTIIVLILGIMAIGGFSHE